MRNHEKEDLKTRRDFFRQAACASLGVTGLVNALAQMRLMTAAMAQTSSDDPGYKAIVCLFLNGGNDSNNLLVPTGTASTGNLRSDYQNGRGVLALPAAGLHSINVPAATRAFDLHHGGTKSPMGLHPKAGDIAQLFNDGDLAFLCNTGTLAFPVPGRADYLSGNIPLPVQLFSHSDQQTQWQSSVSDKPFSSGWGGRAADLMHTANNMPGSKVSMSISLAGINSFQVGTSGVVTQYVVSPNGTVPLSGFGTAYASALNSDGSYKTTNEGKRLKAFENIMRLTHGNLHEEEYNRIVVRARETEGTIGAAVTASSAYPQIETNFTGLTSSLQNQLKMVAKLIAGRSTLGNNRQVFFCQVGGYDTHQTLLESHGNLVDELNKALKAFAQTLKDIGVWDNVVTFTASDFNRTFSPNNLDASKAGSDHGWGSHAMIMGGPVNGGDLYGSFPSLKMGDATGSIDAGAARGRWIPTTSVDQYSSVLTKWMGASSSELEAIFPNLSRFDDPTVAAANLGFL